MTGTGGPDSAGPMEAPAWCRALLRRLAREGRADEVVGDLEEAHRNRIRDRGRGRAVFLTALETLDLGLALLGERIRPGISTLDVKLSLRMLIRHPGITVLGAAALAFAIFVGAGTFEFVRQVVYPALPLEDGDRIVGIRVWDTNAGDAEARTAWDFTHWRRELRSIEELAAWDTRSRNLIVGDDVGTVVSLAEISASAFRIAGVPPHLGRWLTEEDQRPGAEPVVVLGFEVWRDRLGAAPDAVGRLVRLGDQLTTVVGVMPEGFRFPVSHDGWIPLPESLAGYGPLEGPTISVFGRLADGADRKEAAAELAGVAGRMADEQPATHSRLRAEVVSLPVLVMDVPRSVRLMVASAFLSSNIPVLLFLVIVGGNVALLMFARVVAREAEMAVRSALGASRGRIIAQLFVEGLMLTSIAAVVGLSLVRFGMRAGYRIVEFELLEGQRLPFWFHASLSVTTVLYAGVLIALAAAVVGLLPALKATKGLRGRLQQASAGGGGFRFGGVWTAAIVGQIAVTCIAPVFTIAVWAESRYEVERVDLAIPAEEYLGALLELDPERGPDVDPVVAQARFQRRYRETLDELSGRLLADSRVAGVAFSERLPRQYHPWNQIEVEGPAAEPRDERGHRLARATVNVDFFRALDAPILQGRDFDSGDLEAGARNVIVNESFVRVILGDRHPIGRRFRYLANERRRDPDQEPGPWYEIVGVAPDLGVASGYGPQGVYHPARPADIAPVHIVAHVPGSAETFGAVLQATALRADATLRVRDVTTLARVTESTKAFYRFWFALLMVLTGVALVLSLGGIYAIMSFTVTQRTREIAIRVALGSTRAGVVGTVLRRPLAQVALGVATGVCLMALMLVIAGEVPNWSDLITAAGYAMIMLGVCLTACVVPVRDVLKLEVREALGVEG